MQLLYGRAGGYKQWRCRVGNRIFLKILYTPACIALNVDFQFWAKGTNPVQQTSLFRVKRTEQTYKVRSYPGKRIGNSFWKPRRCDLGPSALESGTEHRQQKLQIGDGGENENFLKRTMLRPRARHYHGLVFWFNCGCRPTSIFGSDSIWLLGTVTVITNEEILELTVPFSEYAGRLGKLLSK